MKMSGDKSWYFSNVYYVFQSIYLYCFLVVFVFFYEDYVKLSHTCNSNTCVPVWGRMIASSSRLAWAIVWDPVSEN